MLFERFLDLNRREAPDIDIDFCKDRRGEVIQYVKEKYGAENVAQIGTFGTLAARAAIRDVGRALAMPIPRVDTIVAMVPEVLNITLDEALEQSADLKKAYQTDGEVRELLDLARKIEGLARNVGTHAAAVVIADRPLTEYVPLCRVQNKDEVITQWAMADVERAGLLKMDFLGLRNLTVLSKAVDLIEQTTGKRVDPYQVSAGRCRGVRPAVPRRNQRHFPIGKRRHPRSAAEDEARPFPRHHRHQRTVSSRSAGRRHGRRLRASEARPQKSRATCIRS